MLKYHYVRFTDEWEVFRTAHAQHRGVLLGYIIRARNEMWQYLHATTSHRCLSDDDLRQLANKVERLNEASNA